LRLITVFGLVSFGGGFLWISPPLRANLFDALDKGQRLLQAREPYSYIGVGIFAVLSLAFYLQRGSQPR